MFGSIKDWIVKLFLGKYLGLIVRHTMGIIGTYLVTHQVATPETAAEVTDALTNLLTSQEVREAVGSIFIGGAYGSSLLEKKLRDK